VLAFGDEPELMPQSHRTTRSAVLLACAILALTAGSAAAFPHVVVAPPGKVPAQIVFPVIGPVQYTNDYGDSRPQGGHQGNDIMAPKRSIVVAAESGKVKLWTTSARAGCMMYLYGESGTTYLYVHLNNDLTKGNDNRGKCVPGVAYTPGLKDGAKVDAGEPVGYLGDSGDANGGAPHLHFELHPNDGAATNPFPHLNRALRLLFAAPHGVAVTLSLTGSVMTLDPTTLTLHVDELVVFPLRIKLTKLTKPLTLALPPTTLLDAGKGATPVSGSTLGVSLAGRTVLVLTEPAAASLETQSVKAGAFAAARIVVR
jgi:hypothetical protein